MRAWSAQPGAMANDRAPRTAGIGEVGWNWLAYVAILPLVIVTYARLAPGSTYHFDAPGVVGGGLSRALTDLDYPVAMAALPLVGHVYRAHQPTPGEPALASVHLGLHEGLAGGQMVLTALLLSRLLRTIEGRPRLRASISLYLGLLFCYGGIVALNDGWNEQLVKRGTVSFQMPYLLTPKPEIGWGVLLLAALAVHLVWFRREYLAGAKTAVRS